MQLQAVQYASSWNIQMMGRIRAFKIIASRLRISIIHKNNNINKTTPRHIPIMFPRSMTKLSHITELEEYYHHGMVGKEVASNLSQFGCRLRITRDTDRDHGLQEGCSATSISSQCNVATQQWNLFIHSFIARWSWNLFD